MTDESTTAVANRCYRHPDRESFVRCQRCGRTICGQCQTLAAVGVHCPECVREARGSAPRVKPRFVTAFSSSSGAPVVTYLYMGVVAVVTLISFIPKVGSVLDLYLGADSSGATVIPWSILTHSLYTMGGIFSLAISLFVIFVFGRLLESSVGRARYLAYLVLSALGGAAGIVIAGNDGISAGTADVTAGFLVGIFLIQRHLGSDNWYLLLFLAINIGYNLYSGGVWESIVGGAVAAAVTSLILIRTRRISRTRLQVGLLVGFGLLLVAICVVVPLVGVVSVS